MKRITQFVLALALCVGLSTSAQAQDITVDRNGTGHVGITVSAFNTTDSLIFNGELVMIDTTSTIKRFGVRRYDGGLANRVRVVGLAKGNIPRSGTGSVLIWGYHSGAHATKALGAGQVLKIGAVNGSMATAGDSLGMGVARVLRGVAGITNKDNARYGVWWFGIGGGKID